MCESQPAPTRCIFRQQDLEALLGSSVLLPPPPPPPGAVAEVPKEREMMHAERTTSTLGELGPLCFLSSREAEKDVADRGPRWFRWVLAFSQKSIALRTFDDVRAPAKLSNHGAWVSGGWVSAGAVL